MNELTDENIIHILQYENGMLEEMGMDTILWSMMKQNYKRIRRELGISDAAYEMMLEVLYQTRHAKDTASLVKLYQQEIEKLKSNAI